MLVLLLKISPKVSLPEKYSGTFPSVFGDCSREFSIFVKSASRKQNSGTFPSVFGGCFWGFPLKSASLKKTRERSRVFMGTAPENFPKVSLPEKNSGTFPSVFGDCSRGFPLKSASPNKIRERSRVFLGNFVQNSAFSKDNRERFQSQMFLGIASQNVARGCPPDKIRERSCFGELHQNIGLLKNLSWLSKCSWDLLR